MNQTEMLVKELIERLEESNVEIDRNTMTAIYTFVNYFKSCDVEKFLQFMQEKNKNLKSFAKKMYGNIDDEKVIANIIFSNYFENGYSFHLTNGYNAMQIENSGIGPQYKQESAKEVVNLKHQFNEEVQRQLFIFAEDDTTSISYSGEPLFKARYGKTPEWFLEFSEGTYDKNADVEESLQIALRNIGNYMSNEEKEKYSYAFRYYWNIFSQYDRKLIMLPNSKLYPNSNKVLEMVNNDPDPLGRTLYCIDRCVSQIDADTEVNIPASELIVMDEYKREKEATLN